MPSGKVVADRSISNFVVAIPNTKLRIEAEGRPARSIRPVCNRPVAIHRQTT